MTDYENLNLDKEAEELKQHQLEQEQQLHTVPFNKEAYETGLQKTLCMQDLLSETEQGLATLDKTFYTDFKAYLQQYPNRFNRNMQYHLQSFYRQRMTKILSCALAYNSDVYTRLTTEEQTLYLELCRKLAVFKELIEELIKI